jgi:hypothetical protein
MLRREGDGDRKHADYLCFPGRLVGAMTGSLSYHKTSTGLLVSWENVGKFPLVGQSSARQYTCD